MDKKKGHKGEGHRQRLRERFLNAGLDGFQDYEVIELLLTLATPRKDCKDMAKAALARFKSLQGVMEASSHELCEVDGIGRLFAHTDDIAIGGVRAQTLFDNGLLGDDAPDVRFFQGVIDEVALYDRALTAGRIGVHAGTADFSGDINGDGTVDLGDFMILSSNFNGPGAFEDGDINFDEQVNMADFTLWRTIFQGPAQRATAAAVPEPVAGVLAMFGLLVLPFLRRRRTC